MKARAPAPAPLLEAALTPTLLLEQALTPTPLPGGEGRSGGAQPLSRKGVRKDARLSTGFGERGEAAAIPSPPGEGGRAAGAAGCGRPG
jgi:hypothetical protein